MLFESVPPDRVRRTCRCLRSGPLGAAWGRLSAVQSATRASPLLAVRELSAGYGHVQVLFGVSFTLARGETVALIGPNGSGRTTLLRTLGGLLKPAGGTVHFCGRDITLAAPETRFRLGMVQLHGGDGTFASLSVGENLRASLLATRLPRSEIERRRDEVLADFPVLADRLADPARELSGGQRQMLALAMVLQHRPELLMIDELSLGLAPIVVRELMETLARLAETGLTMLIVEQSLNVALDLADRAVVLESGEVVRQANSGELRHRDSLLRAAGLGEETVRQAPGAGPASNAARNPHPNPTNPNPANPNPDPANPNPTDPANPHPPCRAPQ